MHAPDLHPGPGDRDNTLLVVLIALLSLPAIGIVWVWLRRADFLLPRAIDGTLAQANDDPLLLAAVVNLGLLLATGVVWIWRDAKRRLVGVVGRTTWVVVLLFLGAIGLWIYLAARPPLPPRR